MINNIIPKKIWIRHIALPQDHGSWIFLISPLLIGLFAGSQWSIFSLFLIICAFAIFLIRQPVTAVVKIYSGRRSQRDLGTAIFWLCVYGLVGLFSFLGLVLGGYVYLLVLGLLGIPVFVWHLYLVSKRAERRQMGIEVMATGVLSLAAPAAFLVNTGYVDPLGWWLFLLTWLQSAASIVYAYLRLEQRQLTEIPSFNTRLYLARRALLYTSFNVLFVTLLSFVGVLATFLFLPYLLQWFETIWGASHPSIGKKPTSIGLRQLIISSLFTILFIITWNL
jgi:hypothetical protein